MEQLEVSHRIVGRKRARERNVIGVLCPTPFALYMGIAMPIYVSLGDVTVDWRAPPSAGLSALLEMEK